MFEGKRGNESYSVQMLVSCAILPKNDNGCSPAPVDIAWKFIENSNKVPNGKIVGGYCIQIYFNNLMNHNYFFIN